MIKTIINIKWYFIVKKNEIIHNTETYCKMRKKLYSLYVPIKLLIASKFRLLFTYNADSICDLLSSLVSLHTQQANLQHLFRFTTKARRPE